MTSQPQNPFYNRIPRNYLTEKELDAPIDVILVAVYGSYTTRGEHRKEIIEKQFEIEVEVPMPSKGESVNKGHVKLAVNRHVRRVLGGIRARTFQVDTQVKAKPCEHKRRVRDFISERGMRDNDRSKREYERNIQKRKAEADALAAGIAPAFADDSDYGADGLPRYSEKTYISE